VVFGEEASEWPAQTQHFANLHSMQGTRGFTNCLDGNGDAAAFSVHYAQWNLVYAWYPEHQKLAWLSFCAELICKGKGFDRGAFDFYIGYASDA
jgi:hypothetical protein